MHSYASSVTATISGHILLQRSEIRAFSRTWGCSLSVPFFWRYSYPKARSGITGFLAEISVVSSCRTLWWQQCHRYPDRFQCIRHFLLLIRSLIFFSFWSFSIKVLSFVLFLFHLLYICCFDGIWSSGWNEPWEGLLVVTDLSTSWAEAILRVKGRLEIQTNIVMLWSLMWLVAETVMWLAVRMVSSDWWIMIRFVSEVRSRL